MIGFEVAKMTRCVVCADPVIYLGPAILEFGRSYCSEVCCTIYKQLTPGRWVDAEELAPGGSLHNRPELWSD
jgi:hypothetical protein